MGFMDFLKNLFGGGGEEAPKTTTAQERRDKAERMKEELEESGLVQGVENIKISDGKVIREVPGAALIEDEDDEEQLWTCTYNTEIPFDAWKDVWGPLGAKGPDTLATYCYHEAMFSEGQMQGPDQAEAAVKKLGYDHVGHFFAVQLTVYKHWGTRHGDQLDDIVLDSQEYISATMKGQRMKLDGDMKSAVAADPNLTAPIEGVTIEVYAQISAKQATGLPQDEFIKLIASHGMDLAKWETVSSGWTDRMSKDTTYSLTQIYGAAFQGAGQGQFGAASQAHAATGWDGSAAGGAEPIPFDKVCEIQGATSAWSATGKDVNALLQSTFGMNAMEWSSANSWWLSQLTADVSRFDEYNKKVAEYEAKYKGGAGGDADSDISF